MIEIGPGPRHAIGSVATVISLPAETSERRAVQPAAARAQTPRGTTSPYSPRRPADGVLHRVVRAHLETFLAEARARGHGEGLPHFVERELRAFITCGQLTGGFARFRCEGSAIRLSSGRFSLTWVFRPRAPSHCPRARRQRRSSLMTSPTARPGSSASTSVDGFGRMAHAEEGACLPRQLLDPTRGRQHAPVRGRIAAKPTCARFGSRENWGEVSNPGSCPAPTRVAVTRPRLRSVGSLTASIVHPREVFKAAIIENAAAIILLHNHPSGDATPSQEDEALTARLRAAGDLLGIRVLDYVVIGSGCYVSFVDSGRF